MQTDWRRFFVQVFSRARCFKPRAIQKQYSAVSWFTGLSSLFRLPTIVRRITSVFFFFESKKYFSSVQVSFALAFFFEIFSINNNQSRLCGYIISNVFFCSLRNTDVFSLKMLFIRILIISFSFLFTYLSHEVKVIIWW